MISLLNEVYSSIFIKFQYYYDYKTPLHIAVQNEEVEIIQLLLKQKNIKPNSVDEIIINLVFYKI